MRVEGFRIGLGLRFLLACGLIVAAAGFGRAERLPLKIYTTADGLVSNRISRIVRDSRGYLWFCTENGLSRFDGVSFTNYTTEQGLPDNGVDDLLETRDGTYWVATGKGLCRYNPKGLALLSSQLSPRSEPMFAVYHPDGDQITWAIKSLYEDRSGTLWCGTWRGLYRLERVGVEVKFHYVEMGMPAGESQRHVVRNMLEDRRGALWLATDCGLYRRLPDGRADRFTRAQGLTGEHVLGLIEDRQGNLWAGVRFGGLVRLVSEPDSTRPIVARQYALRDGLGCVKVTSLFESSDGRFWIGTDCGLDELREPDGKTRQTIKSRVSILDLSDPRIWSLCEDRQGNLWMGTAEGAAKLARGGFTTYTDADGLGSRKMCLITETRGGELCVYSRSPRHSFINRLEAKERKSFVAIKPNLPMLEDPSDCVFYMQDRESTWWAATPDHVFRYPKASRIEDLERLRPEYFYPRIGVKATQQIFSLYEDRRGDIWISTRGAEGLLRWERRTRTFHAYPETRGRPPAGSYAEDAAGNLWIAFAESGIARYENTRFRFFMEADGLPAGIIGRLYADSRGRLWASSSRGGLARIDDTSADIPHVVAYTTAEGLSSNNVISIVEDRFGRLYIGTDHGLDRLDPATNRIKHFTSAAGLAGDVVDFGYRDRHGALWFSTDTGLSKLIPELDEPEPPSVLINRVQISGRPQEVSELGEMSIGGLQLGRSQNSIQIDFVGLALGTGDKLRYQYRLEGADADWQSPTTQRSVSYANMAPGPYRFLVRAVNGEGVVSESPATLEFTILSPVWGSWWFVMFATLVFVVAAYADYQRRRNRRLELERVRARIAADLHDDVGANLTRIAILSEVANHQLGHEKQPAHGTLSSIANISRESVASMRDIVWAINPKRDRLFDLTRRMRSFASDIFTHRQIQFRFRGPQRDRELRLGPEVRRDVFLIFKEAVNNIVRHSECAHAAIELRVEGHLLELNVIDDGKGIDVTASNEGQGLASMRRRAESFGGKLEIDSSNGRGTTVRLSVPLAGRLVRAASMRGKPRKGEVKKPA